MKLKFYAGKILFLFFFLNFSFAGFTQTTETFETQGTPATQFTSGGKVFLLKNSFQIYNFAPGGKFGYAESDQYVDNSYIGYATLQKDTIMTADATLFTLQSLWIYLSSNLSSFAPTNDGSVTFRGRLNGVTQFTATKSSGFKTSTTVKPDNGFTFINFATEFGSNYSNIPINELEVELGGAFQYIGIDNFTWTEIITPVSLISYTATLLQDKTVKLNWQTAAEENNSYFIVERSSDGNNYTPLGRVEGKYTTVGLSSYELTDQSPLDGINYYRLKQYDIDGKSTELGIKTVTVNGTKGSLSAYPNPVILNYFTLNVGKPSNIGSNYQVIDMGGRVIATGKITNLTQTIDVSGLKSGIFMLQLSNGNVIRLLKK